MKLFQIFTGLLAAFSLVMALVTLFTQPLQTVVTNDRVFFGLFMVGAAFVAMFLWSGNQIHGTINTGRKS